MIVREVEVNSEPNGKVIAPNTPSFHLNAIFDNTFTFRLTSLDAGDSLTFLTPLMGDYDHDISSGEEGYGRPFNSMQNAQSVEAPRETFTFPELYLDARYASTGYAERGIMPPDIDEVIAKLISWVTPNTVRMRKHRMSVRWGQKVIGDGVKDYLYLNSIRPVAQQFDDTGRYVSALITISGTLYGYQKSGA